MSNEVQDTFAEWFTLTESTSQLVLLLISIFSFPLYCLQIFLILRNKSNMFHGPFYRIMLIGMLTDVMSVFNIFIGQIVPARKLCTIVYTWDRGDVLAKVFYTITYGGRGVQGATAMLLAFNRVSAVCAPIFYRKFIDSSWNTSMLLVQLSGLIASLILIPFKSYTYQFENDGYYASFSDLVFRKWFYLLVSVLECFFVIAILVFNVVTLVSFHFSVNANVSTRRSSINQRISLEKQKIEQSMSRMTFIVCSFEIVYFIFVMYTLLLHSNMNKRHFYFFYNILGVLYSTFSAWMLLFFSKPITLQIMRFFNIKTTILPISSNDAIRITTIESQNS